jgi:hypothetical protein
MCKFNNSLLVGCMTSSTLWDVKPCSALKVERRFGGTCRFHLSPGSACHLPHAGFLPGLLFELEAGGEMFLRKFS